MAKKKKLQSKFEEAAAIAAAVPEEFREAAFNRALDELLEGNQEEIEDASLKSGITPDAILGRSIGTINIARTRLGMDELDKDQVALTLATMLQTLATNDKVSQILSNADELVKELRSKGQNISDIIKVKAEAEPEKPETPTQVLQDLVKTGFFKTARTAADVVLFLEQKGMDFTVRQIAPALLVLMRQGNLSRTKNKSGRYEYKSKKKK